MLIGEWATRRNIVETASIKSFVLFSFKIWVATIVYNVKAQLPKFSLPRWKENDGNTVDRRWDYQIFTYYLLQAVYNTCTGRSFSTCLYICFPSKQVEKNVHKNAGNGLTSNSWSSSLPDIKGLRTSAIECIQIILPHSTSFRLLFTFVPKLRLINWLGLQTTYKNEIYLVLAVRCLAALAFEDKGKIHRFPWSSKTLVKFVTIKKSTMLNWKKLTSCAAISKKRT